MDFAALMAAVDQRRFKLGEMQGRAPLSYVEVAAQLGLHSAMFSRLRKGTPPSSDSLDKLLFWLGADADEFASCDACPSDALESAASDTVDAETPDNPDDRVAAIHGSGRLSTSEDPETQAAIVRVQELLREGAVGVSILHDMDPDTMPSEEEIEAARKKAEEDEDYAPLEDLYAQVKARPRHVAIVDTAAFSDARITLGDDGFTVSGPVVFEGKWTGDGRRLPYGGLVWDEDLLPISILWDRQDGDHSGMVVGSIDQLWRVEGEDSALRPEQVDEEDVEAVTAAMGTKSDALPAAFFEKFTASKALPVRISAPDENGLRHIYGHAAPRGVCHRSDLSAGSCFQYPGDADRAHTQFHTGAEVTLDNGKSIRVGALTFGGAHIDGKLAKGGVTASQVGAHRDNANRVFSMVRSWEDNHGLAFSGVVLPDVTQADLMRILTLSPSVELWPTGRSKALTLVGIHFVPRPAWPVTASAGSAEVQTFTTDVEIEDIDSDESTTGELEVDAAPEVIVSELAEGFDFEAAFAGLLGPLARMEQALALLVEDKLADVPMDDEG